MLLVNLKRYVLWLLAFLPCSSLFGCSNSAQPIAPLAAPVKAASFDHVIPVPPIFVDSQSTLDWAIPVKNDTAEAVIFTHVRQSCACMGVAKMEKMRLQPGEESSLKVSIDLRLRHGPQRFLTRLVEANGREWSYSLNTVLYRRAEFGDGSRTLHFGMVDPNSYSARGTYFTTRGTSIEEVMRPVSFHSSSKQVRIDASAGEPEQAADGTFERKHRLQIALAAPEQSGHGNALLTTTHDEPVITPAELSVTWNTHALIVVEPQQLYFGKMAPDAKEPVRRTLTVRRADGLPIEIKSITPAISNLTWTCEKGKMSSETRVAFAYAPKRLIQPLWSELVLETNCAGHPHVRIPVAAFPAATE